MRTSLVLSLVFHCLVLTAALVSFRAHERTEMTRPVSVEVVTPSELSSIEAGKPDRKPDEATTGAPPAEKPSNIVQTAAELRPSPADSISQKLAALPPPKPKALPSEDADAKAVNVPLPQERPEPPKPHKEAQRHEERHVAHERHESETRQKPRRQEDRIADLIDRPTPPARETSKFDPKQIAALLNRDPTAGARPSEDGPREPWRRPSSFQQQALGMLRDTPPREAYGEPIGRDTRMSSNEIDAFRAQIARCWTPPVGGLGGDPIVVKLRITLNEDGTLSRSPEVSNSYASPFFRPAADSAVRAVMQCQPYQMPSEKYAQWRDMLLTFDPSRMYGG